MKCMWGCGQPGIFECTSFYGKRDGLKKCSQRWQGCPAKQETKELAAKKLQKHMQTMDRDEIKNKRLATLAKVDENGITGFRRNALAVAAARRKADGTFAGTDKMVKTKRSTKDANGRDIYQQTAIKTAKTRFGLYAGLAGKPEFEIYRYYVKRITEQQPLHLLDNYKKRAAYGKIGDPHQVDHKFSIVQGYLNNIPPFIIGHISNLEMLPARKNNSKGSQCSVSKEKLFEDFFSATKLLD